MKIFLICATLLYVTVCGFARPSEAEPPPPGCLTASLSIASGNCQETVQDVIEAVNSHPGNVAYKVVMECGSDNVDGLCNNPRACPAPPGTILFAVLRSDDSGAHYQKVAEVCLSPKEWRSLNVIDITMIEDAFATLNWPGSPLTMQPPNGRTLVNFKTNFLTTNTAASTQSVPMLGHTVDIEATPTSWLWHFGDGADATTSTPGAAYPALDVTHAYLQAAKGLAPSVDTVYHGRYRIDGGDWADIPVERTIPGTPVDLTVVEARPVLVAPGG